MRQQQRPGELYRAGGLDREEMGDLNSTGRLCTILPMELCRLPKKLLGPTREEGQVLGLGLCPPGQLPKFFPTLLIVICQFSHSLQPRDFVGDVEGRREKIM